MADDVTQKRKPELLDPILDLAINNGVIDAQ